MLYGLSNISILGNCPMSLRLILADVFRRFHFEAFLFLSTFYCTGINDMLVSYSIWNLKLLSWFLLPISWGSFVWVLYPSLLESILKWSTIKELVLSVYFCSISFNNAFWAVNFYLVAHVGSCCHGKIPPLSIYFC